MIPKDFFPFHSNADPADGTGNSGLCSGGDAGNSWSATVRC